jgi:CBS domain-containing protein
MEASRAMRDRDIGDVLVATAGGRMCGMLTDRDIVVRAVADGRDMATTSLGEVCTAGLVTIGPEEDVSTAIDLMRHWAIRRLPVVDPVSDRLVGIISLGDLWAREQGDSALADISRAPASQ